MASDSSYNAKRHRKILWVLLVFTTLVCIAVIPFFLTFIANMFSGRLCELKGLKGIDGVKLFFAFWAPWVSVDVAEETQKALGVTLLPDFLGGMAGILVGFILDFSIINKIRTIGQYESMIEPLNAEFDEILGMYWLVENELREENEYGKYIKESIGKFQSILGDTDSEMKISLSLFLKYNSTENDAYNKILSSFETATGITDLVKGSINNEKDFLRLVKAINKYCDERSAAVLDYLLQMPGKMLDDILSDYENCTILYSIPNKFGIEQTLRDINHMIKTVKHSNSLINYESYKTFQRLVEEKIPEFYKKTGIG